MLLEHVFSVIAIFLKVIKYYLILLILNSVLPLLSYNNIVIHYMESTKSRQINRGRTVFLFPNRGKRDHIFYSRYQTIVNILNNNIETGCFTTPHSFVL